MLHGCEDASQYLFAAAPCMRQPFVTQNTIPRKGPLPQPFMADVLVLLPSVQLSLYVVRGNEAAAMVRAVLGYMAAEKAGICGFVLLAAVPGPVVVEQMERHALHGSRVLDQLVALVGPLLPHCVLEEITAVPVCFLGLNPQSDAVGSVVYPHLPVGAVTRSADLSNWITLTRRSRNSQKWRMFMSVKLSSLGAGGFLYPLSSQRKVSLAIHSSTLHKDDRLPGSGLEGAAASSVITLPSQPDGTDSVARGRSQQAGSPCPCLSNRENGFTAARAPPSALPPLNFVCLPTRNGVTFVKAQGFVRVGHEPEGGVLGRHKVNFERAYGEEGSAFVVDDLPVKPVVELLGQGVVRLPVLARHARLLQVPDSHGVVPELIDRASDLRK